MEALQVLILGANKYEFKDQSSGNMVTGTSVHYCQLGASDPNVTDRVGLFPAKVVFPYEYFESLKNLEFPVLADASIRFDLSNKKNPIKVTAFSIKGVVPIKM